MEAKEIKDLLRYVRKAGFQEFELRMEDFRLRVVRDQPAAVVSSSGIPATSAAVAPPSVAATASTPTAAEPEPAVPSGLVDQTSPMVGTFYRSPSPEADPFVKEGDVVSPGQVLCIIEAMKLMNEIEAEVAGEIVEIPPENAQPVEFGEPIFRIRPFQKS